MLKVYRLANRCRSNVYTSHLFGRCPVRSSAETPVTDNLFEILRCFPQCHREDSVVVRRLISGLFLCDSPFTVLLLFTLCRLGHPWQRKCTSGIIWCLGLGRRRRKRCSFHLCGQRSGLLKCDRSALSPALYIRQFSTACFIGDFLVLRAFLIGCAGSKASCGTMLSFHIWIRNQTFGVAAGYKIEHQVLLKNPVSVRKLLSKLFCFHAYGCVRVSWLCRTAACSTVCIFILLWRNPNIRPVQ